MNAESLIDACAAIGHEALREYAHALGAIPRAKPWSELSGCEWTSLRTRTGNALHDGENGTDTGAEDALFVSVVRAMATALGMPHTPTSQCAKGATSNLDYERGYHDAVRDIAQKIREHRPAGGVAKR